MEKRGLAGYFPKRFESTVAEVCLENSAEEIRVRVNSPMQVTGAFGERLYPALTATESECREIFMSMCEHSVYAHEEDTRQGYVTLSGSGIRVGLSGAVTVRDGKVVRFSNVCGFNIRLPHEHKDCAKRVIKFIATDIGVKSTLITAVPGVGKTTLLRDLARLLSDNYRLKVCICDERSELAACLNGIPTFDIGIRTDVVDGCPKHTAMQMAIRALSPEVIVTDEMGGDLDKFAAREAIRCGVSVIASTHGSKIKDIGVYDRHIILYKHDKTRVCDIYNEVGEIIEGGIAI